jgi:glycosyltransferase involved in cell wall biosynthesis
MLRVTAFTGGKSVPSARFRVRQYIPELRRMGIEMREAPARFGSYPPAARALRPGWGVLALAERFRSAVCLRDGDVTLLQREMLSTLATFERWTKPPRVLDVDDAIWLLHGGQFAVSVARCCDTVICGNPYIADFFAQHARRVAVLPTAVDTDLFRPAPRPAEAAGIICWSGTGSGLPFLYGIEKALSTVLAARPARRLRVVCDAPPRFSTIPAERVEFVRWSEEVEVAALQDASVAIMPLDDSAWARGKCSYKLLTYMACGLPVVASPVGMNAEVLARGEIGFGARNTGEWIDALESILRAPGRARAMGEAGRGIAVRDYSLRVLGARLAEILRTAKAGAN